MISHGRALVERTMRRIPWLIPLVLVAGCGAAGRTPTGARTRPAGPSSASDAQIRAALHLPARVPVRPTGSAPAAQVAVVRRWLDELRAGHVLAASRRFALPSRFQNFTDLALIRTAEQAYAVTRSLPCGARMTAAGGANGFVVYEAKLTDRPGGGCGAGIGSVVRGAVLVRDGKMIEWYRLPDRSRPRHGQHAIPNGPLV